MDLREATWRDWGKWYNHTPRKGDQLVCSYHVGILLLSILGKLFTQSGVDATRSQQTSCKKAIGYISALRLIGKTWKFRKDHQLYICFIDLKATFDTVDHTTSPWKIWKIFRATPKIFSFRNIQVKFVLTFGFTILKSGDTKPVGIVDEDLIQESWSHLVET